MALDLTGIQNENEFYTSYYLREVLENDLKDEFSGWAEQSRQQSGERPPDEAFGGLSGDYFQARNQLLEASSTARRLELQRELLTPVLETLGYEVDPMLKKLRDDRWLPVLAQVTGPDGTPELCVVEAPPAEGEEDADPLEQTLQPEQFEDLLPEHADPNTALAQQEITENRPLQTELAEVITKGLYALDEPPRYVLVANGSQIALLDRNKWSQKRLLRFELDEILSRKDPDTLKATVSLLHRQSTCPEEGFSLLDTFDENAHKHAFAVSEDLKYALREAIELLGNEAIRYIQDVRKEKTYDDLDEEQLTNECLRYMYRLLFLLYVEARPELGYAPMDSDEYLKGYSVEHLRDLELMELTTEESKNGFYIHHSLERLFSLVFHGYPAVETNGESRTNGQVTADFGEEDEPQHHTFTIEPLRSHLFDPERTPLLSGVKFRNEVLQKVIRLMSLSDPDRRSSRERVSYAALGINQLGAVYEALLSYSGFFAEKDLYEVKEAGEDRDPLDVAYFVGEDELDDYAEDEIVFDDDGTPLKHEKGTFIYRLAGREREESASYYTPEVLTDCLVKYALKELIGEDSSDMPADDILDLTVCEPAMGSGAFLNEAVDQLAEAYLQRKQEETGEYISHEEYNREKQKVKMYLADNNVFGVDLNPVATELAEVSLWLNTIYEQRPEAERGSAPGVKAEEPGHEDLAFVPWFGMQLTTGNSLIGARRQVYEPSLLEESGGRGKPPWMETPPDRVEPGEERPDGHVYHFLLPDYEMANYSTSGGPGDLAEEEIKDLRSWRRDQKSGYDWEDLETLQRLSEAIDGLWEKHRRQQRRIREQTTDPIKVWGQPESDSMRPPTTTRWKDETWHTEMHSEGVRMSSPYRRLKLVMDYWCALWFWPIDEHDTVPTRQEWLMDLQMILEGDLYETSSTVGEQQVLFEAMEPDAKQLAMDLKDEHGFVNVDKLCDRNPRLGLVQELADRYKFHHWELEYADLFEQRGGFDLTIGNPPWVKVTWDEQGLLADVDPKIDLRGWSKKEVAQNRMGLIEENHLRETYLADYESAEGKQAFQNARQNYPSLEGMQANSYKCFLPQGWIIGSKKGISSFLHPEGVYDDTSGGSFRKKIYTRLRRHYQFVNVNKLFKDILHWVTFSVNVYSNKPSGSVFFDTISNLYSPKTVDESYLHDGSGSVPGLKDENHDWNTEGHSERIVQVDEDVLALFAKLYDEEDTPPRAARLSTVHSQQTLDVLQRFTEQSLRLKDLDERSISMEMWHETNAQEDGTIGKSTQYVKDTSKWIISGPHFFVSTPFYKTPQEKCTIHHHYDVINLREISDDYLPRTNYVPSCSRSEYYHRMPTVPWKNKDGEHPPVTKYYRFVHRRMLSQEGQRTLICAIIPPGTGHINTVVSTVTEDTSTMVDLCALCSSLPYDFYVRSTDRSDLYGDGLRNMPYKSILQARQRVLLLNCLTSHYVDLWNQCWQDAFRDDSWTKDDPRLNADTAVGDLAGTWDWDTPLRTRYARRQALVELDVLAAQALGLTLEELQTIYRAQFPVLRENEQNTWYDQNGRIIYTKNRGLPGVGFKSKKWKEVKDMTSGTVEQTVTDDTQPGGPTQRTIVYEAPFTKCDREADYERAWGVFEGREQA